MKLILGLSIFFLATQLFNAAGREIKSVGELSLSGQIVSPLESELTSPRIEFSTVSDYPRQTQEIPVDSHGKFKIQVNHPGIYAILITAGRHNPVNLPLIIPELKQPIQLQVVMKPAQDATKSFDPTKYGAPETLPKVTYNPEYQNLATIFEMTGKFAEKYIDYRKLQENYRQEKGTGAGFSYDSSDLKNYFKEQFQNGKDISVRQTAGIYLIDLYKIGQKNDPELFKKILEVASADALIWSIEPYAAVVLSKSFPSEKANSLLQEFLNSNPCKFVQARVLATLAQDAKNSGMTAQFQQLYEELKSKYGDIQEIQSDLTRLNPEQKLSPGKPVPDFKALLLESGKEVTNQSMAGKFFLVDFWASWCGGCQDELAVLHRLYQQYHNSNFEILSLSLDKSLADLKKFRDEKWKLPWLNVFLEGGFTNQIVKDFEINQLPTMILVGPDGKIVAAGEELRGDGLENALARYLKPATK